RWEPNDHHLIAAVTEKWKARPACGSFLRLSTKAAKPKSVLVRVVDLCGGCKPGVPHVDLSKRAFEALYGLDVGLVEGIRVQEVKAPKKWDERLYGPHIL
ncbi:hypothetical protein BT69DRAFT_1223256, partial [Atractiella rhizophila]